MRLDSLSRWPSTDPAGAASLTIGIGPSAAPCDVVFYFQWLVLDIGANALDLVTSSYGRGVVGF